MTKCPLTKEQLKPIFDDIELMEQRIEQLEQLCRDLYGRITYYNDVHDRLRFDNRMDALGLLEGGDKDAV